MKTSTIYAGDTGGNDPDGNALATPSRVIAPNSRIQNWLVGLQLDALSGAPTCTVEFTDDDVMAMGYDPNAASSIWHKHQTLNAVQPGASGADGNFVIPVRGIRLRATGGAARLRVLQSG